MLAFLTDAHISLSVADQIKAKRPELVIYSLQDWRGGALLQADDDVILTAALEEGLTLVTYDQRTIAPIVMQWAMEGRDHAGIIFIDEKSITQADVGGKVRALLNLWDQANFLDWTNVISYLKPQS
ncbi:MAG TPA: DUF5615 family PIN-like protein [Chthonomonadaceae bacterium]|nr:DUF5615 family PIN-like protein [Chthonomonadaceae bacterium]